MEKDENRDEETLEEEPQEEEVDEEVEEQESEEEQEDEELQDWEAEAKKWKAIAERNKKKKINTNINSKLTDKAENPDVDDRIAQLELAEKKRQFGYEHGLSPVETDKIFQLSKDPDDKVLKDPFVKAGLKALRSQERLSDNSPSISAKAQALHNKDFSKMSKEEKQAEFQKYMKKKGVIE